MKTVRYTNHTLMTKDNKFITGRVETEVILQMIYSGENFTKFEGKTLSVFSDKIETVEGENKRVTVIEVTG